MRGPRARYPRPHEWHRTNDLARRAHGRRLEYLGRADDVIKSRGYRIGPSEIEDALLNHPLVAEAAAVGIPDDSIGQRVKVFLRFTGGETGGEVGEALRAELCDLVAATVGPHARPREFEVVSSLPRTETGKLLRRELARPRTDRAPSEAPPPETASRRRPCPDVTPRHTSREGPPMRRFWHVGLNVTDMDRTIEFYRLVGFEVVQDKEVDDANLARAFMIDQGSRLRFAHMRLNNSPDEALLDIIEWHDVAGDPRTGHRRHRQPGPVPLLDPHGRHPGRVRPPERRGRQVPAHPADRDGSRRGERMEDPLRGGPRRYAVPLCRVGRGLSQALRFP